MARRATASGRLAREGTMSIASMKVPALVATGLICFAVGVGAGAVTLAAVGDRWGLLPKLKSGESGDREEVEQASARAAASPTGRGQTAGDAMARGARGAGGGNRGRGGRGGADGGRGRGRGGFTPSPKNQLAALVTKLD